MTELGSEIRTVCDFPKKGIGFKDITTLLKNPEKFALSIDELCAPYHDTNIDIVVGIEARGFIFGGAMATALGAGFVPVRKPGKLPADTIKQEYSLEYGTDAVEIHEDGIEEGQSVLIVDDLLATGGTMAAAINLVRRLKGRIIGTVFLIELDFLNGRSKLGDVPVHVLIHYDAE